MIKQLAAAASLVGMLGFTARAQMQPSIDVVGVWRTVQARDASGNDITDRAQRTTFIFTQRHFSITWSAVGRPQFPAPLTDSQKVAMWAGFGAQSGTYERSGDTLTLRSDIAKSPTAMAPGAFQTFRVWRDGRAIWMQLVGDNSGPLPHQERIKLIPLE